MLWMFHHGSVQGQDGEDFEQLGLVEGVGLGEAVPAHSRE